MDLFGDNSFFQYINRTTTLLGKNHLANFLSNPFTNTEKIINNQLAIQELSQNQKFTHNFRISGSINKKRLTNSTSTLSTNYKYYFIKKRLWKYLSFIFPIVFLAFAVLYIFKIVSIAYLPLLWLVCLIIHSLILKQSIKSLPTLDQKVELLNTYSSLLKIIETENFTNNHLKHLQKKLYTEKKSASLIIKKLEQICKNINLSYTPPFILIFNPIISWNLTHMIQYEQWLKKYNKKVSNWLDVIAEFETLISLATFSYNHPDYSYPQPTNNDFTFIGEKLGHPLIPRKKCIKNDIYIPKKSFFLVVTGANMAGKSTFLRTIGLNHLLACLGAPVCAKSLIFSPSTLITNLRTSDSLINNQSYFFSELKRLKMIIDELKKEKSIFIILDEILKGTNSEDKQKGSLALIKQLIQLQANGIIATHDLILGTLETEFPENVKNYYFESDIDEEELSFSYEIKEGIVKNMNASFLMKKMGITGL